MALSEGELLSNRYQTIILIGKGGMADVYKVWDQQRAVHLAIKVLHEDIAMDRVFIRRFQREGQVLERLQHPNIVRYYGLENDIPKRLVFLLMDLIEGRSLKHEIFDRNGSTPLPRVMELMRPICAALYYAHHQGIVHADVKPGNILINNLGQVFVSDFGIARLTESATVTLVGAGTPPYMAPEQFKGSATPLSDQYSLGIMLFELLTGERPFTGEMAKTTGSTQEKIFWEHLYAKPPSPRRWNRDIPPAIEKIVMQCLEKKPEDRFVSVLDLLTKLESALAPRPVVPAVQKPLDETIVPAAPKRKPARPAPQPAAPVFAKPPMEGKTLEELAKRKKKELVEPALQPPAPVAIEPGAVEETLLEEPKRKRKGAPLPVVPPPVHAVGKAEEEPVSRPVVPAPTPLPQEAKKEQPISQPVIPARVPAPRPARRRAWAFALLAVVGLAVLITPLVFIASRPKPVTSTPNIVSPTTYLPTTPSIPILVDTQVPLNSPSDTPTFTLTPHATFTNTKVPIFTPTSTRTSTSTWTPTITLTFTRTPTLTLTYTPTKTPTNTPTLTRTPTPTPTRGTVLPPVGPCTCTTSPCATFRVLNNYVDSLRVYMDMKLLFTLASRESSTCQATRGSSHTIDGCLPGESLPCRSRYVQVEEGSLFTFPY